MPFYDTLFFDLDGTLSDSARGVYNSILYGLEKIGRPAPAPPLAPSVYIGPPVRETLMGILGDAALVEQAFGFYQERYAPVGLFENELYFGVPDMLKTLHDAGYKMVIATTKVDADAARVLEYFKILPYFDFVAGAALDGSRESKADVLRHGMEQVGAAPHTSVMIGDRHHDMEGAQAVGMDAIGVLYGFGTAEELAPYHPVDYVQSVSELVMLLGRRNMSL